MQTRVGRRALAVACGLWLAGASPAAAQTASDQPSDSEGLATGSLQDLLETRVPELRDDAGLTAVAVAAMIGGDLAGAAVSGERRRNSGISVTVDDRWHMGSITKSMTATLLAVLEEDGLLFPDDALTALLPDVEMADGWSACTLDHLLTHTAGVAANFPDEFQDVWPETAEELVAERRRFIADALADEPESPCGERFQYSNVGYTIAGHIAETVAGEPYEALIQNRVFLPLELFSAGFGPPRGEYADREPVGHAVLQLGSVRVRVPVDPFETRADNSPLIAPAGTVHMTIGDLARYGATHLDGEYGSEPVLLPQPSWERLHAPFLDDYARGWVRQERDWAGGSLIWHNGSNSYWYALLMLLPATNMTLAFVTNDGDIEVANAAFGDLAQELSAAVLEPAEPATDDGAVRGAIGGAGHSGVKLTDARVK
ncbi:MAG: serine hydrolase [Acidobacteria bacterium]|nr:serine hydrolase [Acidobacteriota bacterium]